jgi:hypothetical protein
MTILRAPLAAAAIIGSAMPLAACATSAPNGATPAIALEEIYVLRSIRERRKPVANWCSPARTGFEPFPADAERFFSFWSVRAEDGKIVDAKVARVAELHGCFGPTNERARQNFYAEVQLSSIAMRGNGECLALSTDFPKTGLFPVRCQLVLSGASATDVGGLLTTNTLTSKAPFGPNTEPLGYTQASIATIRLWQGQTPQQEMKHEP